MQAVVAFAVEQSVPGWRVFRLFSSLGQRGAFQTAAAVRGLRAPSCGIPAWFGYPVHNLPLPLLGTRVHDCCHPAQDGAVQSEFLTCLW